VQKTPIPVRSFIEAHDFLTRVVMELATHRN
jgi:hypothetical protein